MTLMNVNVNVNADNTRRSGPSSSRLARGAVALLMLLAVATAGGGCALPGAIAYKVFGPPPIPARYAPPQTQPMLILVENAHSGSVAIPEADELSRVLYDELHAQKTAPPLIDPAHVHELRDHDPSAFARMTIAQIGRALGADQVLYVEVNRLDLDSPPASEMVKLRMTANVKVVDATSAVTAWPQSADSEVFEFAYPPQRIESGATASQLKRQVLHAGGIELSRWFYDYKPETMKEENSDVKLR
ncbi:MAG TPA: hypothetical protein VH475_05245 [Tepidisphaeraceae bacterium]|jgi:hypothetical protein